jgi:hypothetical protein
MGQAADKAKKRARRAERRADDAERRLGELAARTDRLRADRSDARRQVADVTMIVAELSHRLRLADAEIEFLRIALRAPEIYLQADEAAPEYWDDMSILRRAAVLEAEDWLHTGERADGPDGPVGPVGQATRS